MSPANPQPAPPPGLRERKKAETRRRVADVAARMFIEQGYDNVRMIDIARAADISEPTLYNYFPTKEHLILDRDREFEEFILAAVAQRLPGQTLAESLRSNALAFLNQISPAIGKPSWVPASVSAGPELRRIWLEINARSAESLTRLLAVAHKKTLGQHAAKVIARAIVALFAMIVEGVGEGNLAGKSRRTIIREMHAAIDAAVNIIAHGLPRASSKRSRTGTTRSLPKFGRRVP